MELGQGMEQKNIQTLRLSPLQIQNLSVLEMNGQELSIFIENERMENPMLELEDGKVVQYGPIDRAEAAQKQSRTIRKPRKSNGSVSATHVLLKVTKHEEGRH